LPSNEHKWYIEYSSPYTAHIFTIEDYVIIAKTKFQQVEIADTYLYGRCLFLDGKIQSAAFDEYIYHEALVHPVMLIHPMPKRILVIGGGEGATLREVFKHPSVDQVVMVDIDQEVVELCRRHLRDWHRGSFEDSRLELHFADAREFIRQNETCYDIIISDLPEPVEDGPSVKLFTRQFYELVKDRLNPGGLLALQAGDFCLSYIKAHCAIYNTIKQVMPAVYSYHIYIPSFNSDWGFLIAARDGDLSAVTPELIDSRIAERQLDLRFYDGQTHRGMFSISLDIRNLRDRETTVIDDQEPFTIY
jgi:spermidine synthase